MAKKKFYIAATGQHKGKTTSTLGIAASLQELGYNVGYCKPVGQQHVTINNQLADKDVVLFGSTLNFTVNPEIHSPVIIASGVTTDFIEDPSQFSFKEDIKKAQQKLDEEYEIMVYEGTGHSGVGSVIGLSNAQVAKLLDAEVILVVEGGIGKTIDRLNLNLALFREQGIKVRGIIVNKVHVDKMDKVKLYLQKHLDNMGLPLLGVLPYDRSLSYPILGTIRRVIKGRMIFNNLFLANQVEDILAGSLIEIDEFTYFQNIVLVVNYSRYREALHKIIESAKEREIEGTPLSGIIITSDGRKNKWYSEEQLHDPYIEEHQIPLMTTSLDTYDTVVAISRIEVKINVKTPWKVRRATELIQENIDVEALLKPREE